MSWLLTRSAASKPSPPQSPGPSDRLHVSGDDVRRGEGFPSAPQFSLLSLSPEDRKRRRLALGISPVFEAVAIAIVFWALMTLPPNPVMKVAKEEEVLYFHLPTPPPVQQTPRMLEQPAEAHVSKALVLPKLPQQEVRKPLIAHLKIPKIPQPRIQLPKVLPAPNPPAQIFTAVKVHRAPKPQRAIVHMGAFNPGSMAKGTVTAPLRKVQAGGFGAQNGIPNNPAPDSHTQVAQLGSFDLPSGPGHGNGTAGMQGTRGTVASSGFGNATGAASGSGSTSTSSRAVVRQSGFGNAAVGRRWARTKSAPQAVAFEPVIILSKPNPVYPPEARRLHIEGQVILSVLFEASGHVRVLRVVQGLGHGMDGAAIRAAEQIRFKSAERNGRPINSAATVHIIFQLAY